jgi:hypothetical protein
MMWYLELAVPFVGPLAVIAIGVWLNRHTADDPMEPRPAPEPDAVDDDADRLWLIEQARDHEDREIELLDEITTLGEGGLVRELLVLWPGWQTLVGHVSTSEPLTADPQSVVGAACACDRDRLVALLYAHQIGDTIDDAEEILSELLAGAAQGRRPRTGRELGLRPWMFAPGQPGEAA